MKKRKPASICYLGFPTSWIGNKRLAGGGLCRCLAKRWHWTTLNSGSKSCRALHCFPNVSINCMYQAGMHNHMFWCFVFWSQRSCNTFAATTKKKVIGVTSTKADQISKDDTLGLCSSVVSRPSEASFMWKTLAKKKENEDVSFDAKTGRGVRIGAPIRTGFLDSRQASLWRDFLGVRMFIWGVCAFASAGETINRGHNEPLSQARRDKAKLPSCRQRGPIDLGYVLCVRGCVCVCVCYDFSCTLWPTCSMKWVSRSLCVRVCLRGRFTYFYIWPQLCNPGYSICEANGEAFALECFCACVHGSQCVRIVSTSSPAVALLHLFKNCVVFFFYLFPFPPVGDQKVEKGWGSGESWGWIWICDTYITAQRACVRVRVRAAAAATLTGWCNAL